MAMLQLIIKNERVAEIIRFRPGVKIVRDCEKMCLIEEDDPQFAGLKQGDPWPSQETRARMAAEAAKKGIEAIE